MHVASTPGSLTHLSLLEVLLRALEDISEALLHISDFKVHAERGGKPGKRHSKVASPDAPQSAIRALQAEKQRRCAPGERVLFGVRDEERRKARPEASWRPADLESRRQRGAQCEDDEGDALHGGEIGRRRAAFWKQMRYERYSGLRFRGQ
eukprot:scaffold395_cov243-Pinguiococcus_pyrenoidosus.AAC.3